MADHVDDAFEILEDVDIPEPQHAKAASFELPCSFAVSDKSVRRIVLSAIQLDHETSSETGEVGDKSRDWNLAAEVPAFLL